jgi:transposase InsO family protein
MKNKTKVFAHFQIFISLVKNQYNKKKILRTDNGTKFINQNFTNFTNSNGIIHQTLCVYTPQQNGVSERKNHHLLEMTRTLLFQNNVPKTFWSEVVLTSTYLINGLPSSKLNFKSPFKVIFNRKFKINHLKIFGCTCFVYKNRIDKLDCSSTKLFFRIFKQKKGV